MDSVDLEDSGGGLWGWEETRQCIWFHIAGARWIQEGEVEMVNKKQHSTGLAGVQPFGGNNVQIILWSDYTENGASKQFLITSIAVALSWSVAWGKV